MNFQKVNVLPEYLRLVYPYHSIFESAYNYPPYAFTYVTIIYII